MTTQHTPGPWAVGKKYATDVYPSSGNMLVARAMTGGISDDESHANARLIAASPELLAACRRAVCALAFDAEEYEIISSAINKATGGAA